MCILRYRKTKLVPYSYEHGGGDLLPLKDLVSDIEDPEKSRILSYLNTNCISACPGIVHDEINPELDAGCGNMYSDGTYTWTDTFIVYVDRYNIPVPEDFRNHILENFKERQKRQVLFRLIDEIEIENNPLTGYHYKIKINKKGTVFYQNSYDCKDGAVLFIKSEDAAYILNPIMGDIFCYDTKNHGVPCIDAYYWKVSFYRKGELVDETEGWPGEDEWRYEVFKGNLEFIERYVPRKLGTEYMKTED